MHPKNPRNRSIAALRIASVITAAITLSAHAETITVAAASDLKFAMEEIVSNFRREQPAHKVEVVYGSSGKFQTQIRQGAPYDLFFSADIAFPRQLAKEGFASSEVTPYAIGRIVLWSLDPDTAKLTFASLLDPGTKRIAIANPKHAPYGNRAEEALLAMGMWKRIESKLVFGENIAHAAQFVQTGNAQVGIVALALVLNPELSGKGCYRLIPDSLHRPLEQGFIVTKRAEGSKLASAFAAYMAGKAARSVMTKYGFVMPARTSAN